MAYFPGLMNRLLYQLMSVSSGIQECDTNGRKTY